MWSDNFMNLSNEQRLLALSTINDTVRTLRRGIIVAQNAVNIINLSDQDFTAGWQGTLISDIDEGTGNQAPAIRDLAVDLEAYFLGVQ